MRKLIFVILLFISAKSYCQYTLKWTDTTTASGVTSFEIQQSVDNVNWSKVITLEAKHKKSNDYSTIVIGPTFYYRVVVNSTPVVYSNIVYVYHPDPTVEIKPKIANINLQ